MPPSQPQTKPKACNFALRFARGEYLVIYDAEDRPEPDQLRKVVATFRRSPPNTACLQCRLNYYNASENWLTRMFTLDYALWFDQVLPGLERLNMPIPLGGTSNHFRIDVLRELHAWDPFNVTEDADLGIRIGQKGYRVGVVDSTTFEEASCHAGNWIRQRSRWIKGYMQTLLVHTRRPLHLIRSAGPLGFLGFVFFIGGTVLSGLLNPIFWVLYLVLARRVASAASIRCFRRSCCSWPVQSARRQRRLHLSEHAGADPARLARSHSLQPHRVRLLGADVDRRLQGALAAAAQSVLLGKDPARRLPATARANSPARRPRRDARARRRAGRVRSPSSLALMLAALAVRHGFVPDDAVRLWAGAIDAPATARFRSAASSRPIRRSRSSRPLLVALVHADGTPAPALLAAGLLALIAGLWFASFRARGLVRASRPRSSRCCSPFIRRCCARRSSADRPTCALCCSSTCSAARSTICARAARRSEVMAVGLALLGLAFSHPIGAAIAFAAVPFLVFAVRPVLVANSALNVVVALVFPTVFCGRRVLLCVVGLSRRRLELFCRAGRKPGGLARRRRARRSATASPGCSRSTPALPSPSRSRSARRLSSSRSAWRFGGGRWSRRRWCSPRP